MLEHDQGARQLDVRGGCGALGGSSFAVALTHPLSRRLLGDVVLQLIAVELEPACGVVQQLTQWVAQTS